MSAARADYVVFVRPRNGDNGHTTAYNGPAPERMQGGRKKAAVVNDGMDTDDGRKAVEGGGVQKGARNRRLPSNGISCHRFYECIDNVAYSCQNPKVFQSKCSGKYWNWRGKADYICLTIESELTKDATEQAIAYHRQREEKIAHDNELLCNRPI